VVKAVTLEEASRQNPSLLVSSPSKAQREAVLEQIKRGDIASCQALFERKSPTMLQKLSRKLRRIIKR
ncbi:MAG: hypothetical protein IKV35_06145, partial [Clostridia bacterium]|nr:hypothetical protein [Clostridia bacterium]